MSKNWKFTALCLKHKLILFKSQLNKREEHLLFVHSFFTALKIIKEIGSCGQNDLNHEMWGRTYLRWDTESEIMIEALNLANSVRIDSVNCHGAISDFNELKQMWSSLDRLLREIERKIDEHIDSITWCIGDEYSRPEWEGPIWKKISDIDSGFYNLENYITDNLEIIHKLIEYNYYDSESLEINHNAFYECWNI